MTPHLNGKQRLLIYVLVTVATILFAGYFFTRSLAFTALLGMAVLTVLRVSIRVWGPPDYGKYAILNTSIIGLLTALGSYRQWPDDIFGSIFRSPSPDAIGPVEPTATSSPLALGVTLVVFFVIIYYSSRETTTVEACPAGSQSARSERSFRLGLQSLGQVLRMDLDRIDRETAWTAANFEPLDAFVEIKRKGRMKRTVAKLLDAIRADRKSRAFLVLGDPGSGKSVALRKLARNLLAEINDTGRVPVYVDLKEWRPALLPGPEAPALDRQLLQFIETNTLERCDIYASDFLNEKVGDDTRFASMVKQGRFFFILDSFDEIPAILNRDDPESDVIECVSLAVYKFLCTGPEARGILASRLFRKPGGAFDADAVYELKPFSDLQIRNSLRRTNYYKSETLRALFTDNSSLLRALRTPFTVGLLVPYSEGHPDELPKTQVELYKSYLESRVDKIGRTSWRPSEPVTPEQIVECTGVIAETLFQKFGLEAPLEELKNAIESGNPAWNGRTVEAVVQALEFVRIARVGDGPERRFSFVHRRLAEFFVARRLNIDPAKVPIDAIAQDELMREPLALYCEMGSDATAAIAEGCWNEISSLRGRVVNVADPAVRRAVHCLRFIGVAFRATPSAIGRFRDALGELVYRTVRKADNVLSVKFAVECTGVLSDRYIDKVVAAALRLQNAWIVETAIRACRHLDRPSVELSRGLLIYVSMMTPLEFVRRQREFLFAFSLSDGFRGLRRACYWRVIVMLGCCWEEL